MIRAVRMMIALFTAQQRRWAVVLVLLMLGGMVLETLGIGLVIPALLLLTDGSLAARFPALADMLARRGIYDPVTLVATGMFSLAAVYTFKCLYVASVTSLQMRFVYRIQADLSRRLFVDYLRKPYTFHLQRNSSQLLQVVVGATNELTMTGLVSTLILMTELMVTGGIALLLLYMEPVGAMVAGFFLAAFGFMVNALTRRSIRRAGAEKQVHEGMRIRYLQQALGGAKELKLLGREEGAVAQYLPHNEASARIGQHQATLQALPKLWLELLAVLGLVVLVLSLVWQGRSPAALVPTLGMFAAAAFRLIPSMNRILGSVQYIRLSGPVIETLYDELIVPPEPEPAPPAPGAGVPKDGDIALEEVAVRYPGTEHRVIEHATLRIARGTTVGFIGGSGAGKSTLVDALLGLLPLEAGRVSCGGVDIHQDIRGWQGQIGYVPQSMYLTDESIRRNIALGLADPAIDENAIRDAVAAAQLDSFVAQLPEGLDTIVGERGVRLSGGQRQRIGIARALYHRPSVLVLDEATSSLDAATESEVMEAINAMHGDKTILVITHRAHTLEHCDRVFRVERGHVVEQAAAQAH
jgi:ABC-type multidrug transport system fused ATPase/permease subunit